MSKATKRKFVTREVLEEYVTPSGDQQIVKVVAGKGNNLHEVQTATEERFLVSMPSKFRRNIWIRRGDFVVVEPIKEGGKVKAEISHILYANQIKYLKEEKLWPSQFSEVVQPTLDDVQSSKGRRSSSGSSADDSDEGLFVNTNRPTVNYEESDSDSSSEVDN